MMIQTLPDSSVLQQEHMRDDTSFAPKLTRIICMTGYQEQDQQSVSTQAYHRILSLPQLDTLCAVSIQD
jgi:hypothetical protein